MRTHASTSVSGGKITWEADDLVGNIFSCQIIDNLAMVYTQVKSACHSNSGTNCGGTFTHCVTTGSCLRNTLECLAIIIILAEDIGKDMFARDPKCLTH